MRGHHYLTVTHLLLADGLSKVRSAVAILSSPAKLAGLIHNRMWLVEASWAVRRLEPDM